MNTVGEPYSGKPNVRIDEGRPGEAVPNRAAYSTADPLVAPVGFSRAMVAINERTSGVNRGRPSG